MRDLIVSVAIVAVLVVSWLFFSSCPSSTERDRPPEYALDTLVVQVARISAISPTKGSPEEASTTLMS